MKRSFFVGLLAVLGVGASAASAQVPPAASVVPPGFKIVTDQKIGPAIIVEARKANDACPKRVLDKAIGPKQAP
jgi:hypothetical protein